MVDAKSKNFDIVPSSLAVRAMRDSGYRNAAYAIAELVDNAIQAKATVVEVICKETDQLVQKRSRRRVVQIAVVDNGVGMDSMTLRKALQFGNGERLDDRSGIGRFGMGLPNSSMSQAKRVEVWTWQNGVGTAIYSYLSLDEIASGDMEEVPKPKKRVLPKDWGRVSAEIGTSKSGTVVVWSDIDRCDWKTAHAIFRNSEYTIGRIYRRFLRSGKVRIRMCSFVEGAHGEVDSDENVRPNDPLYLMADTSCPTPWNHVPMFERVGKDHVINWKIGKEKFGVTVRISVAKRDARQGHNPGGMPHGKHARNNMGVSIIRADRELEIQTQWCSGYDPVERWWGVEVDFPPALDEVFGVTNNKQSARTLLEYASITPEQIAEREGYGSEQELREAWKDDSDQRLLILEVKQYIERNVQSIRNSLKAQTARKGGEGKRHSNLDSAENIGTKATEERFSEGYVGESDRESGLPAGSKIESIEKRLIDEGVKQEDAHENAQHAISEGSRYLFYKVEIPTPEFFTVRLQAGTLLIGLNTSHPLYHHLIMLLEEDSEGADDIETLRARLRRSYEGLKLLLEAWARYEDELTDGPRRERAQEARMQWGIVARQFFRKE